MVSPPKTPGVFVGMSSPEGGVSQALLEREWLSHRRRLHSRRQWLPAGLPPPRTGVGLLGGHPSTPQGLGFPSPSCGTHKSEGEWTGLPLPPYFTRGASSFLEGLQVARSLGSLGPKISEVLSSPNSCPPKSWQLDTWRQARGLWAEWGTQRKVLWRHPTASG